MEKDRGLFSRALPHSFGICCHTQSRNRGVLPRVTLVDISFPAPKGREGGIQVERVDDSTARVGRYWYIDEFENFTRYLKSDKGSDLGLREVDLREILEQKLQDIVSWNKSDMIAHPDYEKFWSVYSREEWLQMSPIERLPKPKL